MIKCLRAVVLLIACTILLPGCKKKGFKHTKDRIVQANIKAVFRDWVSAQVKAGNYWANDSCNPVFIKNRNSNNRVDHAIGVPDESKISYSFSDLNGDGIIDGLVTFTPKQCDCIAENNWTQYQMLVLSTYNSYAVKDTFFNSIGEQNKGFYHLDSISSGQILGTYYEFQDGDNKCCPSIQRPIEISFSNRTMYFLK